MEKDLKGGTTMKTKTLVALMSGAMALGGCGERKEPVKSDYNKDYTSIGRDEFIVDINLDGKADGIGYRDPLNGDRRVIFFAEDMRKEIFRYFHTAGSAPMTDEMRNLTSKLMKDRQNLAYLVDKTAYDISQASKK